MKGSILDTALTLASAGLSVIPIKADGSKAPACPTWKEYQKRIPSEAEIRRMFSNGVGIAIVAGEASGNLEVLDIENTAPFEEFCDIVRGQDAGLLGSLPLIETPSGGKHLYYRCREISGNLKLALSQTTDGRTAVLFETRGQGGYVVTIGSSGKCHPTGKPYALLQGSLISRSGTDGIAFITVEQRSLLLDVARSFNEAGKKHSVEAFATTKTDKTRPGDLFNQRATWQEILLPQKWTDLGTRGEEGLWRRPGKDCGISATTNYCGSDLLYVFSTNASPFEPERAYSKFAAYALLEHGGDFRKAAAELRRRGYGEPAKESPRDSTVPSSSPWASAQPANEFVNAEEGEVEWIDFPFLAPGTITEIFSPRGIGKSHIAVAKAILNARKGRRVLLLDRDNARREVRRRLQHWGARDCSSLHVMTRDQVPPLTDVAAWETFPFQNYDVLVIDSLDSSTEGVGEKDSSKPSRAIAPLLDIAHRTDGPAILVLGNTIKSGQHSRGSGIVEDRADICFEVRDVTGFIPTGDKPWWEELPPAGAEAWAQRSSRRKQQDTYRLAFIPSKFRVGEEPNPFVLEINLGGDEWTLRDATDEMTQTGFQAQEEKLRTDTERLLSASQKLQQWAGEQIANNRTVMVDKDAVPYLMKQKLTRAEARTVIHQHEMKLWRVVQQKDKPGSPKVLLPLDDQTGDKPVSSAEMTQSKTLQSSITCKEGISADPANIDRRKCDSRQPLLAKASSEGGLFPPDSDEQAGWSEKV